MKAFVTGGTGFVGSAIVKRLLKEEHEVIVTGCSTEIVLPPKITVLQCNFNGISWRKIRNIDVVFHEAAFNDTLAMEEQEMFMANVFGPMEIFERCYQEGCRQFVYASSTAVYGNEKCPYKEDETPIEPLNAYGHSKAEFEKWATEFAIRHPDASAIGLRYCNVYGPGEKHKRKRASMIYQIAQEIKAGREPVLFQKGQQKRDWIYIDDVVEANMLAMKYNGSDIFNCGTGKSVTFNTLVELISEEFDAWKHPIYIPCPFPDKYQKFTKCCMEKAKKKLEFIPQHDVSSGIKEYMAWLKEKGSC